MDLETTLSDLMSNITNIIEDRTENLHDLASQKIRCKEEIKTTRDTLNTYFDDIEDNLLADLQKTFTEKELRIQTIIQDFELKKSEVCKMQDDVNIVKSIATGFQSFTCFMAIRKVTKSANTAETFLQHSFDQGKFDGIEILNSITSIELVKENLKSFGTPVCRVHPPKIKLSVQKTRGAQLTGPINISGSQKKLPQNLKSSKSSKRKK